MKKHSLNPALFFPEVVSFPPNYSCVGAMKKFSLKKGNGRNGEVTFEMGGLKNSVLCVNLMVVFVKKLNKRITFIVKTLIL